MPRLQPADAVYAANNVCNIMNEPDLDLFHAYSLNSIN